MNLRLIGCVAWFGVAAIAVRGLACTSGTRRTPFDLADDSTQGFARTPPGQGNSCPINNVSMDLDVDSDGDGYPLRYDCNECDPNVNVGAFDVPGNDVDEDCNGTVDDEPADCDAMLPMTATDAFDGARAIGLCKRATDDRMWGVVEASWVLPDGSRQPQPLGQGVLRSFGVSGPQAGAAMLALSTGTARGPTDPGYRSELQKNYTSGTPAGYPKASPSCGASVDSFGPASDGAALKVRIRVPSNASSFTYQQNFFTSEFPMYICSSFNDFFVTMMDPKPASLPDGNIAFDQDGNPISVNNTFLQVCQPQVAGTKPFVCPLGAGTLAGTGFEGHAATGWLTTTVPVATARGKEITLMWTIWDQGDGRLDSTALIDDFRWSVHAASGAQTLPSIPK